MYVNVNSSFWENQPLCEKKICKKLFLYYELTSINVRYWKSNNQISQNISIDYRTAYVLSLL